MSWYNKAELASFKTPCYVYNREQLVRNLEQAKQEADLNGVAVQFALKANYQPELLKAIREMGFGVDCVSGGELNRAIEMGFTPQQIGFAGAAKSDAEIELALKLGLGSIHVESLEELEVIALFAEKLQVRAAVLLRLNPNIDANTHKNIRTGTKDDKFGLPTEDFDAALNVLKNSSSLEFKGLHFHIGSQIQDLGIFEKLVNHARLEVEYCEQRGLRVQELNLGGGLGVNYNYPEASPSFAEYFQIIGKAREFFKGHLVVEPGRSLVAHSAQLLTKVLFTKGTPENRKVLVDAGMTDLARPALYEAFHWIENVSAEAKNMEQSVFGPICESSDCFAKKRTFPESKRGDILAIHSVGAYGETMQSGYNLRDKCAVYWLKNENG